MKNLRKMYRIGVKLYLLTLKSLTFYSIHISENVRLGTGYSSESFKVTIVKICWFRTPLSTFLLLKFNFLLFPDLSPFHYHPTQLKSGKFFLFDLIMWLKLYPPINACERRNGFLNAPYLLSSVLNQWNTNWKVISVLSTLYHNSSCTILRKITNLWYTRK